MKNLKKASVEIIAVLLAIVLYGIPFYAVVINSFKSRTEAAEMNLDWPSSFYILENYTEVLTVLDGVLLRAFYNSIVITLLSVFGVVLVGSMAGFVLQRRTSRAAGIVTSLILAGLMIPPAIVPTIWVLEGIGLFRTLSGMILVMIALQIPFTTILYKSFMVSIPREIDESATVDGCGGLRLFFSIIFPLLKPVTSTIIVLSSITIYNDFVHPLYFLPGAQNVTVQLTLFNFLSRYGTDWNYLLANVVLVALPPLVLFIFFNKKIVSGMTAGAIKG